MPGWFDVSGSEGGYSLVVEHIVANDKTGVRFSLPAQDTKILDFYPVFL